MNMRTDYFSVLNERRLPFAGTQSLEAFGSFAKVNQRWSDSSAGPFRLLSERDERLIRQKHLKLAEPLIERIEKFSASVMHGGDVIAHASSPLVRQEAARLSLQFAALGMELAAHPSEIVMPSVLQAPSGAIQFEWHRKGVDLEICVLPSGRITGYSEIEGGESREFDLSLGMQDIKFLLNAVLRR